MKKVFSCLLIVLIAVIIPVSASELLMTFKPTVSETYDQQPQARHLKLPACGWSSLCLSGEADQKDKATDSVKYDVPYRLMEGILFGLVWADTITTCMCLDSGATAEGNPVMVWIAKNKPAFFLYTLAISTYSLLALEEMRKNDDKLSGYICMAFVILIRGYAVIHNIHVLSKVW